MRRSKESSSRSNWERMLSERSKAWAFWAKIHLTHPRMVRCYQQLLANQTLSKDELHELNWSKRKAILSYAFDHVPLYRKKYSEAGILPKDVKSPEDFSRIPILTKDEIKAHGTELVSDEAKKRHMADSSTGGSTGVPLRIFHDRRFPFQPLLWRMLGWWGVTPEMDAVYVLRSRRKTQAERWANAAVWWPTRRAILDASLMRTEDLQRFAKTMTRIRPQLIQGYAGSVYQLALFLEENSVAIHPPKAVWVTSSPVLGPQRRKMEEVFQAPVYDQYGCGEVFALAAECRARKGLHVFHDARHVEFVGQDGNQLSPGDYGRVLITDLENRVFPIIRYENGDVGRLLQHECSCGRSLPLIDSIRGRITDCLTLPDGSKISGDYLTTIFDEFPDSVEAFQVRQDARYRVWVRYVPSRRGRGTAEAVGIVRAKLERVCGQQVGVFVERVDAIWHDQGKLRFVISEVGTSQPASALPRASD